jgi:hypothetical protein
MVFVNLIFVVLILWGAIALVRGLLRRRQGSGSVSPSPTSSADSPPAPLPASDASTRWTRQDWMALASLVVGLVGVISQF